MSIEADPGQRVIEALDALGHAYEVIECDPDLADTAIFCERYGIPLDQSGNCIIVASKASTFEERRFAACLVLSSNRLDVNGVVRRLMGVRKASFASAEDTVALTGMLIGGVTPFGLPDDLPFYIDQRIMALDWVVVGGGSRSQKVKVAPAALTALPVAQVIEDLAL